MTDPITGELTVDAHEDERKHPPTRVRSVEERAVVPHGLHLAHLDHFLELSQLQIDERIRRLAIARVVLYHGRACLFVPAARDEPTWGLGNEPNG